MTNTTTNAAQARPVTPEDQLVLVEDHQSWALITINRPEKRNAMSKAAQRRFREALQEVRDKRVVVLTGVGPSFCSGVDLREVAADDATRDPAERMPSGDRDSWRQCNDDVRRHPAVFISAVNGYALGGGSTLIHNSELAVAAESSSIGTPEIGFGAWPWLSGPSLIKRILPKHAAEVIFLAERIDAHTAHRMGIVNEVVPDDRLLTRASELAERIATFDPAVLDWGKKAFRKMADLPYEDAIELSEYTQAAIDRARAEIPGG